jgi:glycosyltransferase involved in cell wall biosynthesis
MRDADRWVAPSRYFAELMAQRLGWSGAERERIQVVPNGISLEGYRQESTAPALPPVIGYLARFIPGKGLGLLVEAFIALKKRERIPGVRLRCIGSMTESDARYVEQLKTRLTAAGCADDVEWRPNVSREDKIALLESLTVFSVPATYGEAFGLYVIEALAVGVPVVLPRTAAFPEIVEATGGGRLFDVAPDETQTAERLADTLESLLAAPQEARALGEQGRAAVRRDYTIGRLAERLVATTREMIDAPQAVH